MKDQGYEVSAFEEELMISGYSTMSFDELAQENQLTNLAIIEAFINYKE